jgi:hypothetical protein
MEDLRRIGLEDVDWIHLAQDRYWRRAVVNTVMNVQIPDRMRNLSVGYC